MSALVGEQGKNGEVLMVTNPAKQETAQARRPAAPGSDPILAAKITAPGVPDWALQRPRITKLIADRTGDDGQWAAAQAGPVAWVCLDEYDNRPGIFWANVLAALRESGVAVPKTLPGARGRPNDHVFLLRLASMLAAQNPPVTLVLDDIHLLTEPKVLTGLDFVLRNAGSGFRLAVCSRSDPLLPLHRYRLTGDLAEIRAADLAFTTA